MAGHLNNTEQIKRLNSFGHYLGTIVATTTAEDNTTTADDFVIPPGCLLAVQPDAACYISSEFDEGDIDDSNSRLLGANEWVPLFLWPGEDVVAALAVTGTVNVKVFKLEP